MYSEGGLEVCRATKKSGGEAKDTWWWNKKVHKDIKEKKECYNKSVYNIEKYKLSKNTRKQVVSQWVGCMRIISNVWAQREKDIYRMAKVRERKTRVFNQVKCIKDKT